MIGMESTVGPLQELELKDMRLNNTVFLKYKIHGYGMER